MHKWQSNCAAISDTVQRWQDDTPTFYTFSRHLDKVSRSYWPGLFHCYDVPGLARTNNELESRFRDTARRLLRTTGQKGLTGRTLQRQGVPRRSGRSEAAGV